MGSIEILVSKHDNLVLIKMRWRAVGFPLGPKDSSGNDLDKASANSTENPQFAVSCRSSKMELSLIQDRFYLKVTCYFPCERRFVSGSSP